MSAHRAVSDVIEAAPAGALFAVGDFGLFGTKSSVESALSRLVRGGRLSRVRRGVYFRPAQSRFGSGTVSGMAVALKHGADRAAGPSGASAAAMLGLSTQMPVIAEVAVVGRPPGGIDGVRYRERSNLRRVSEGLGPKDVAVLELARADFAFVETSYNEMRARLTAIAATGEISVTKLVRAAGGESVAVRNRVAALFS